MTDIIDILAAQTVKIVGANSTGVEQVPVESMVDENGKGRLLVSSLLNQAQLVPTITNKLRINYGIANVSLPGAGTFVTLYTRSGTGLFFGFQASFNNSKVYIKLTIDGGQVFNFKLEDIGKFQFNDTTTTRVQMGGFLTTIGNTIDFSSRFAIPYTSGVLVEAASSDGVTRTNTNWMVIQTEDT